MVFVTLVLKNYIQIYMMMIEKYLITEGSGSDSKDSAGFVEIQKCNPFQSANI